MSVESAPSVSPPDWEPAAGEVDVDATSGRRNRWITVAVAVALVAGIAVRFAPRSALWLDEALTVNISRLPVGDIPEALRHDGAPPLYYFVLHFWMLVAGSSDAAVRALSGLFSVAALPLAWMAGRHLGGRRLGWVTVLFLAASPFAVGYASEARMYAMVILLALAGFVALSSALEGDGDNSRRWSLVATALITGALLLTHYWSLFLLLAVAGGLVRRARRGDRPARRALLAIGAGSLAFLPWVPAFLFQMRHTGAPWGRPAAIRTLFNVIADFTGGYGDPGIPLGLLFWALIVLALFGRALDRRRFEIDLRPQGPGWPLALVAFAALAAGLLSSRLSGSAFAARYAAVVFPFVILIAALGTRRLVDSRLHNAVVALVVVLGFWAIAPGLFSVRSNAARAARVLNQRATSTDVIAYCPDQLGPSVSRRLDGGLQQVTFPRGTEPEFVDWVDYADAVRAARTGPFSQMLLDRAGPAGTVWVVWAPGYRPFTDKCQRLLTDLQKARPAGYRAVKLPRRGFEKQGVAAFPPS